MKTSAIIRIVIWSVVACILAGILLAGLRGAPPWANWNINFPFVWNIPLGDKYAEYEESDRYQAGGGSVLAETIDSIEIHWVSGQVEVVPYDGDAVTFNESAARELRAQDQMRYLVTDNGRLIIQFCHPQRGWAWGFIGRFNKSLTVMVPENMMLEDFSLSTASASAQLEGISADKVKIEGVSGALELADIASDKLEIESVSGSVTGEGIRAPDASVEIVSGNTNLAGQMERIQCETVAGGVSLAPGAGLKDLKVDSVSGAVNVTLPENDGFTAKYSTVSGAFTCGFPAEMSKGSVIYKGGGAEMDIQTISGNIQIDRE